MHDVMSGAIPMHAVAICILMNVSIAPCKKGALNVKVCVS